MPSCIYIAMYICKAMFYVCMFVPVDFGVSNYSVFEQTGVVELILMKTPDASTPVTVSLFTVDGTAG